MELNLEDGKEEGLNMASRDEVEEKYTKEDNAREGLAVSSQESSPKVEREVESPRDLEEATSHHPLVEELVVYTEEMAMFHRNEITSPRYSFNVPKNTTLEKRPGYESVDPGNISPQYADEVAQRNERGVPCVDSAGEMLRLENEKEFGIGNHVQQNQNEDLDFPAISYELGRISPTPFRECEEVQKSPDFPRTNNSAGAGVQNLLSIPKLSDLFEQDGEDIGGLVMTEDRGVHAEDTHWWGYVHGGYEHGYASGFRMRGDIDVSGYSGQDEVDNEELYSPVLDGAGRHFEDQNLLVLDGTSEVMVNKGDIIDGRKVVVKGDSKEMEIESDVCDKEVLEKKDNDYRDTDVYPRVDGGEKMDAGGDVIVEVYECKDVAGERTADQEQTNKAYGKQNSQNALVTSDGANLMDDQTPGDIDQQNDVLVVKNSELPIASTSSGGTSPAIRECTTGLRVNSRDSLAGLAQDWESRSSSEDIGELKNLENPLEKLAMDNIYSSVNPSPVIKESDNSGKANVSFASKLKKEFTKNEGLLLPSIKNAEFLRSSEKQQKQQEIIKEKQEDEGEKQEGEEEEGQKQEDEVKRQKGGGKQQQVIVEQLQGEQEKQKQVEDVFGNQCENREGQLLQDISMDKVNVDEDEQQRIKDIKIEYDEDKSFERMGENKECQACEDYSWHNHVVKDALTTTETHDIVDNSVSGRTDEDFNIKVFQEHFDDDDDVLEESVEDEQEDGAGFFFTQNAEFSGEIEVSNKTKEELNVQDTTNSQNSDAQSAVLTYSEAHNNNEMKSQNRDVISCGSEAEIQSVVPNTSLNEKADNKSNLSEEEFTNESQSSKSKHRKAIEQKEFPSLGLMRVGSFSESSVKDLGNEPEEEKQDEINKDHWSELTQPKPPLMGSSKRCVNARLVACLPTKKAIINVVDMPLKSHYQCR